MKELKIRASQLGRLMATDNKTSITQKQLVTLNGLLAKIKLTEKQAELKNSVYEWQLKAYMWLTGRTELSAIEKGTIKKEQIINGFKLTPDQLKKLG